MIRHVLTAAAATLALGGTLLATTGASATAQHWTPGDKRLCAQFTFPAAHAAVPFIRELAVQSTAANGWLRTDTQALVTYALARQSYSKALQQVKRDCSY